MPDACQDDRVQAASGAAAAAATAAPQDGPVAPGPGDLVPEPKSQVGHMLSTACKAQSAWPFQCCACMGNLQWANTSLCALGLYA
jgi:hypothetical protein